jgi:hypothetical protein
MSDQTLLGIMAAIALTFEILAIQRLAPVIWSPGDVQNVQIVSLCAGSPDGGCDLIKPLPEFPTGP